MNCGPRALGAELHSGIVNPRARRLPSRVSNISHPTSIQPRRP
jgi:hypothetical protein